MQMVKNSRSYIGRLNLVTGMGAVSVVVVVCTGSSISNDLFFSFIAPKWGMSLMSACLPFKEHCLMFCLSSRRALQLDYFSRSA